MKKSLLRRTYRRFLPPPTEDVGFLGSGAVEVSKLITISTCHISDKTSAALEYGLITPVTAYEKNSDGDLVGWWIYTPEKLREQLKENKEGLIPEDLWRCMMLAWSYGCDWICLDRDGQEVTDIPWLKRFDW